MFFPPMRGPFPNSYPPLDCGEPPSGKTDGGYYARDTLHRAMKIVHAFEFDRHRAQPRAAPYAYHTLFFPIFEF